MSIATDMARGWLGQPGLASNQARAEALGAARFHIKALLAEIDDLQAQLDAALDREQRREGRP